MCLVFFLKQKLRKQRSSFKLRSAMQTYGLQTKNQKLQATKPEETENQRDN